MKSVSNFQTFHKAIYKTLDFQQNCSVKMPLFAQKLDKYVDECVNFGRMFTKDRK